VVPLIAATLRIQAWSIRFANQAILTGGQVFLRF
jgi:hypothetical protein